MTNQTQVIATQTCQDFYQELFMCSFYLWILGLHHYLIFWPYCRWIVPILGLVSFMRCLWRRNSGRCEVRFLCALWRRRGCSRSQGCPGCPSGRPSWGAVRTLCGWISWRASSSACSRSTSSGWQRGHQAVTRKSDLNITQKLHLATLIFPN